MSRVVVVEFTVEELKALQAVHAPMVHLGLPVNWQAYEDAKRKLLAAKVTE